MLTKDELTAWAKDFAQTAGEKHPKALNAIASLISATALVIGAIRSLLPGISRRNEPKRCAISFRSLSAISSKYVTYFHSQKTVQDVHGFAMTDECDSLLFTSLTAAATRSRINILAARKNGQWFRRPVVLPPCYPEHTKSTISRDMFMGLFWYLWKLKELQVAEQLFDYGVKHNWIMGRGDAARIYMTPALQATLAEIIYRLGGKNHKAYRAMPQSWPTGLDDFQLHLNLLHIELRGQLLGFIDDKMLDVVRDAVEREPRNALANVLYAKYIGSDAEDTANLLMNELWWPPDRLPRSSDRKTDWLNQRAYRRDDAVNADWLPSDSRPVKIHTGGDFLFVAAILMEWNSDGR